MDRGSLFVPGLATVGECEPEVCKGLLASSQTSLRHATGMGQQVGRVGEGTSTGLQPPQPHAPQPHQAKGNRGSGAGRRPREPGSNTGTPPGRTAAVNVPDPGINIFTQHSGEESAVLETRRTAESRCVQVLLCFALLSRVHASLTTTR